MEGTTYSLHGLRVRSEILLAERPLVARTSDVDVLLGARVSIPDVPPPGRLLALRDPDGGGCTIVQNSSGHTIRFFNECDFRISSDQRSIVVDVDPDFDNGLVPLLLTGNVLAALVVMQDGCVLHASGVRVGHRTLATLGGSGQGKSTLAALFCAAGAKLVSDDLLRVESDNGRTRCYTGTAQIRLRPNAAELARAFPEGRRRVTADGRIATTPDQAGGPVLTLDVVLIPLPSRGDRRLQVNRLPKRDALVSLLRYPRVLGWETVTPIKRHFAVCAEIAESVPVFEAKIPWGPPFDAGLTQAILDAILV